MTFNNAQEAQAWAIFFAAQCPKLVNANDVAAEVDAAARSADAMLVAWRVRSKQK